MGYTYDPEKHKDPISEYSLDKFYFIVLRNRLMIFKRKSPEAQK